MIPPLEQIEVEKINRGKESEKKEERRSVSVDMSPMVDLAFLLLTFFMLATTFNKPQAMELLVPAKPTEEEAEKETPVKESRTISLVLKKEEVVWYRGITDPITARTDYYEGLERMLSTKNSEIKNMVVLIKPLESSVYENLVNVLDALNYSGVERYAISPLSEFDRSQEESDIEEPQE